ncbi:MAG: VOC family protein [Acidobacteria bacterium]|mgnify:CR=1 FL=1|nr:MAG: VOC family protein [Acidobacteriota bacterium]REJ98136.1 MAG: VOC family protein [Acidobacteriota bacterium]REK16879.1 MAG: VOC family protein [Acidobacteriota bacterium]REK42790.1 MAG: VOC family protein [Acidobacteriota bacterium]
MSIGHIPKGFTSITPYFIVDDGEKWISFVKQAFDAEAVDEHFEDGKLRHGAFRVFGSMIEGSEGSGDYPPRQQAIHMYVEDCDAVYARAIEAGGKSIHEVMDMEYGERSGGVEDPCGNHWYIATQKVDMYPDDGE